jgi:hypothetical protein
LSAIPSLLSGEKIITKEAAGLPGGLRHGDLLASSRSLEQQAVHHLRGRSLRGTSPRLRSSMMATTPFRAMARIKIDNQLANLASPKFAEKTVYKLA